MVCIIFSYEILIHVCDEVKGISKDFMCPQKLLVVKMGYFSDVTAGQRLEDMDISVHCDLQIFEWLMRWVKKDTLSEELWPFLDSSNVIPILVSAGFLLVRHVIASFRFRRTKIKRSEGLDTLRERSATMKL